MLTAADVPEARTVLFVPGSRPDRFDKAVRSGADAVVIDLEDAVTPADKEQARQHVHNWLAGGGPGWVRVNGRATPWFGADLRAIRDHVTAVVVPKAESPDDIHAVRDALGATPAIIPIIESAAGVLNAAAVGKTPGIARMAFGNGDLATQLGVSLDDWTALLHARSAVVLASAAARLPAPIDGPTTSLRHPELAATQARWAAALGFGGKLCIHPQQVTAVQAAFTPSPRQVEWATRIVKFDGHGAVEVDGEMVDAPIVTRARAILSRVPPRACPR